MILKGTMILAKKEIKDSFSSPLIYILGGIFSLLVGWLFFNYLLVSKEFTQQTFLQSVFFPIFGNINYIFIFFAPLITMRLFAEERKLATIELLLTSQLTHLDIILGKFISSAVTVFALLALTFVFPILLAFSGYAEWSMMFSSYLGTYLSILCFLSVGLFASSLTQNQLIAALLAFSLLLGMMFLPLSGTVLNNYLVAQILQYFSVLFHTEGFLLGSLKSYDFVYMFSFIGFFLYLTHLSLESRKW
ncbi:ABC transporter permease [Bacteriovoracaceae bacterium]|nr:ABC transporter permease [Bacteriovoracaceae bacterium]|tara:strand:+ start:96581 stop:97321 length:741 start_codon:yes stop_codon:yes gene_type:complete